jgi:hypothetical protein
MFKFRRNTQNAPLIEKIDKKFDKAIAIVTKFDYMYLHWASLPGKYKTIPKFGSAERRHNNAAKNVFYCNGTITYI